MTAVASYSGGGWTASLVTINDSAEQSFLQANLPFTTWEIDWIGGKQVGGINQWINGDPFSYTNFASGEPVANTYGLSMGGSGWSYQWKGQTSASALGGYVIEYTPDPPPSAIYNSANGHYYNIAYGSYTFDQAVAAAQGYSTGAWSARLVTINDSAEQSFLQANLPFTTWEIDWTGFTAPGQLKFSGGVLYGNTDADTDPEFALTVSLTGGLVTLDASGVVL